MITLRNSVHKFPTSFEDELQAATRCAVRRGEEGAVGEAAQKRVTTNCALSHRPRARGGHT